jgi:hypothetical protein
MSRGGACFPSIARVYFLLSFIKGSGKVYEQLIKRMRQKYEREKENPF